MNCMNFLFFDFFQQEKKEGIEIPLKLKAPKTKHGQRENHKKWPRQSENLYNECQIYSPCIVFK